MDQLAFLAITLPVAAGLIVWNTPEMLRHVIMRLEMRATYIEAGQKAAKDIRAKHGRRVTA